MKVLHIIPSLGTGGAEKLILSLLQCPMENVTYGLCSLYGSQNTYLEKDLGQLKVKTWYLGKHGGPDPRMLSRIQQVLREFVPDVVHTHRYAINYSLIPQIKMKIPLCVHTIHNEPRKETNKVGLLIQKYAFSHYLVHPIALSPALRRETEKYYGLPSVPYVLNGINTQAFNNITNKKENLRRDLGLPITGQVVLHVGRFSQQKNHAVLIRSFHLLKQSRPDIHLWLVGEGRLRQSYERLVGELGLMDSVHFLGVRTDIPRIMAAADIFALSSDWEGIPLVVMEAMASGLPVVATSVGGVPELITPGVTGLLVPPGHPGKIAEAILRLLDDDGLRLAIGRASQKIARANFDQVVMARKYHQIYLDLLHKKLKK